MTITITNQATTPRAGQYLVISGRSDDRGDLIAVCDSLDEVDEVTRQHAPARATWDRVGDRDYRAPRGV